jgi:hypothetical protein
MDPVFIVTSQTGCPKLNVQELSNTISTQNYQLEQIFVPGARRKQLRQLLLDKLTQSHFYWLTELVD